MSDKEISDIDDRRFDWDGSERFSDRCANCGHTRSDHLPSGVMRPLGADSCKVNVRDDSPQFTQIAQKDRPMIVCPCNKWKHGVVVATEVS